MLVKAGDLDLPSFARVLFSFQIVQRVLRRFGFGSDGSVTCVLVCQRRDLAADEAALMTYLQGYSQRH